jgi:hypothetical protein
MGKAIRLDLNKRTLRVYDMLANGNKDFHDLHVRDKELIFRCRFDTSDVLSPEEKAAYEVEREMRLKEAESEIQAFMLEG